jgi:hypothetical protein
MKKKFWHVFACVAAFPLLAASNIVNAQAIESVIGLDVDNPRAFIAAMGRLNESGATSGQTATVWANVYDGSSPATHTVVVGYNSFEDRDTAIERRNASKGWVDFQQTLVGVAQVVNTSMAVEAFREGSGWEGHGALSATLMSVTDPAEYAEAFARLVDRIDNPGSIRLMQMPFGGEGTTHVALFTAPNAAALAQFLTDMVASDDYRRFNNDVKDIRRINTVNLYQRVATFGN